MDLELSTLLACPAHRTPLQLQDEWLRCGYGCSFPVFEGVPFLLLRNIVHTHPGIAAESFALADEILANGHKPVSDDGSGVDAVVQRMVAHTNSLLYGSLVGRLRSYPIPEFPMSPGMPGELLLDIGCGWGRWSFAAARRGFQPIGIDPSLECALAARRISRQLGLGVPFVVGDSRFLPFRSGVFAKAFSYSVLQHFAKDDVRATLRALALTVRSGGMTKLHLLNRFGLRSLQVQLSHFWRPARAFDTRYWNPRELRREFETLLGPSTLEVDGFFVQGRYEDRHLFRPHHRLLVEMSHLLKRVSQWFPFVGNIADNIFVISTIR